MNAASKLPKKILRPPNTLASKSHLPSFAPWRVKQRLSENDWGRRSSKHYGLIPTTLFDQHKKSTQQIERDDSYRRRFVQDRPEHSQLPDGLDELLKADRLDDVRIHTQLIALHQIRFFTRRGQ